MNTEWMVMAPSVYYTGLLCMGIPTLIAFDILLYMFVRDLMTPRPAFAPASQTKTWAKTKRQSYRQPQPAKPARGQSYLVHGLLVLRIRPTSGASVTYDIQWISFSTLVQALLQRLLKTTGLCAIRIR